MKQFIANAFTNQNAADPIFTGNPAAVCVLNRWIQDETMRQIAIENNLSETAFTVKEDAGYRLRWFTPGGEINLCGHATLATAFILFNYYEHDSQEIHFQSAGGNLSVTRCDDTYELDFPVYDYQEVEVNDAMERAFGIRPQQVILSRDLLAVFESEETVRQLKPNFVELAKLPGLCVGATAPGKDFDCVSRVFAPKLKVEEDPVTGSTHCLITPYWSKRLGKSKLTAFQASERSGVLYCEQVGNRVKIAGSAELFSIAEILPNYFKKNSDQPYC